ncbi:MAG: FmdB family zinc ribbon protein [Acidobacteriota bacterium]
MPLYEYKCSSCAEIFDVLQKFSDEPLKLHAECGGAVERLLCPPAFHFKGSGWYVTDYARGSNGKKLDPDAAPKKEAASSPAKPAEKKTESSASTK